MKNRNILILQVAFTLFCFSHAFNPCQAQAKPEKQQPAKDTPSVKTDTARHKLFVLNSALRPYSVNAFHSKNPNLLTQKNGYQLPKINSPDTTHRPGAKFINTQPANITVPDLTAVKGEGRFSGWIGYTTSRTENPFDNSNDFNWFPTVQDRIHDFSLVGTYKFTDRFTFSGNLIQSNGNLVYGPSGYTFNSYQVGNNVRFDFNATIQGQPHQNFRNSWSVGIYNLNGYWNSGISGAGVVENKILPKPVPSVSWNLKFH